MPFSAEQAAEQDMLQVSLVGHLYMLVMEEQAVYQAPPQTEVFLAAAAGVALIAPEQMAEMVLAKFGIFNAI
jgi:hypothetical protein